MMSARVRDHSNRTARASVAGACLALLTAPAAWGAAGGYDPVVRVEEDWELVLNEPNNNATSPQFHTIMSPNPDLDSYYAQVTWNYRETPGFASGGIQLQSWVGDTRMTRRTAEYGRLSTVAETVTWTQTLELKSGVLSFDVTDGRSTTWGTFGRDLRLDDSSSLSSLDGYDPQASVENSWISYGSNRVESLVIKRVRRVHASGQVDTDNEPKVVFELEE